MEKVRYGILGFGHHAAKRLVPAFRAAEGAKLQGLWRRDAAKAASDAARFGVPLVFDSPEALCASPSIDAVFIVSPDALHLEHVLLAAKHGKAVLCEKPLAMSAAEAREMLAATEWAGVLFGVAQNMRYNLAIDLMRRWIAEDRIGAPQMAHALFCYQTAESPRVWINDATLALGGPIGDVGIHCIDALCYVLGDTVSSVATLAHRDAGSGEVESHAVVSLQFGSGAMGAVTLTARAAYRSLLEVVGSRGTLSCEDAMNVDRPVLLVHREGGKVVMEQPVSNHDAFTRMLDGFAEALRGGDTPYRAGAVEGLRNQQVLDAAYQAWRTGQIQELA
jgi:predicted dehydrogenase